MDVKHKAIEQFSFGFSALLGFYLSQSEIIFAWLTKKWPTGVIDEKIAHVRSNVSHEVVSET